MSYTVVLTDPFIKSVVDKELRPHARVLIVRTRTELLKNIGKADAIITRFKDPVNEELLSRAPRLKVVGNYAVGFNNIDLSACAKRNIRVVNTPNVLTRATAELALTLLLAAARRVSEGEKICRENKFKDWGPTTLLGLELQGRHAVLVGAGRIGHETARLFKGIGLSVEFVRRGENESRIQQKLSRAQVLSLHLPYSPENHHWLSADRLAKLPTDAIVVNTARGAVCDEKALIRALKTRKIFSAGLDVYEHEPVIPPELRRLPNVVLLPHLGSATLTARAAMGRLVISGILAVLNGKDALNEVKLRD